MPVLFSIFIFSFLINFFWESIHSAFLYSCCNYLADKYVPIMLYASSIDGLLILLMYSFISFLQKDILWLKKLSNQMLYVFFLSGIIIASIIEYDAIFLRQKWVYSELMPTIFGLGLSPLLQLSLTGLLVIWLVHRLFYRKGFYTSKKR